jgi:hypothetical protein
MIFNSLSIEQKILVRKVDSIGELIKKERNPDKLKLLRVELISLADKLGIDTEEVLSLYEGE